MKIATWNINSIRLRAGLVHQYLAEAAPDVLCLQETRCPESALPLDLFRPLGYTHYAARGFKGRNGVLILSRHPIVQSYALELCDKSDARHIAAQFGNGLVVHNFYVPAGGDIPDPSTNEKFAHKLDFIAQMQDYFVKTPPQNAVLVGDLNIAPNIDDVWSHTQLLKVVSHTPPETTGLENMRTQAGFLDVVRAQIPEGKLYSWWSYRNRDWRISNRGRRLDHIWATPNVASHAKSVTHWKDYRDHNQPSDHIPVSAIFQI